MRLPSWLEPLPDAAQQRAIDEWAIGERGIPSAELMERAGEGLAAAVQELVPDGRIVVVCGKGNNGGDGLVAARLLRDAQREVDVLLPAPAEELQGDAAANLKRLPGIAPEGFDPARLAGAVAVLEAILGTGFSGAPRAPAAGAIEAINDLSADTVVIACDVPSGVDASTGEVQGPAVLAGATVTFHAGKPGLWIAPGKSHSGEVRVIDIGIPEGAPADPAIGLIGPEVSAAIPRRGRESTKFAAGNVLVCGGSTGLTGAPCLAAEAAMRAGAGYVTLCVPASLNAIFEGRMLEVMSAPVPDRDGMLVAEALGAVMERTGRADVLVLGPGLGRDPGTAGLVRELAAGAALPLLLDADGLNAHIDALDSLRERTAATVLTPHAGELGRLLGCQSSQVQEHRLEAVRAGAARAGAVVVLKGDDTLVADPEGRVAVNRGGASALATAGTGDVLSGVIGAYLAKQMDAFHAACAGVFVHGAAGRLAAREIGAEGVIASDVISLLPRALDPGGG
ncbi:MAG: NAD(P)H-hydrate dehydratase [Actinomycetota bacterium]|nr:NAD(P)H-hydrate dehydratase [Actinomycetota bacterium]